MRRKYALLGALVVTLAACSGGAIHAPGADSANATAQAAQLRPMAHAQAITPAQAALAQWSPVISLPLVPVTGAVLANGKLEFMSADAPNDILYQHSLFTYTALFDPVALTSTLVDTTSSSQDMFCPGTARLPDGRMLVDGGDTSGATSLYDPVANAWSAGPALKFPRGYDASAPLQDGSVLTFGGSWAVIGTKPAERFTVANGWQSLPGISTTDSSFLTNDGGGLFRADNHMWLIATANGKLLHAGPARQMHWLDVAANGGTGGYTAAGSRADDTDSMNGNAVMYDAGKILAVGGSINYDNTNSKTSAFIIDTTQGNANVTRISPMAYPRLFHNSVVLPNGQVIVLGGQTYSIAFSDSYAVLPAELFDPVTQSFTTLAPSSVARNYHSIGLLLLDGRVVSAGGGLCACAGDHENLQILSPPYLFNADGSAATRPVITAAPTTVGYGTTMAVTTNSPITAFSMIRLGAATHTVNNDQRRVALNIISSSGNTYQLAVPTNPGILLPGQWMLFAMNAQGTPSVASVVLVSNAGAPTLVNPGNLTTTAGSGINVAVTASTPSGTLTFTATGLPAGLSINPTVGNISGTPTTSGNYLTTITASNGSQTVSTDMVFYLTVPGTGTGLEAQYFSGTTFTGAATQKLETPTQTYTVAAGTTSPGLSVRWLGYLQAPASGSARIQVVSTQGARLWINGQLAIDSTGPTPTTDTANLTLNANQQYPLMIEYSNPTGTGSVALNWQPPGATSLLPVTAASLYPAAVPSNTNIALTKTATQSSNNPYTTAGTALAPAAVDGNTDGTLADGSVSLTGDAAPQDWWQVDLGASSRVDIVQLWNLLNPAISDMQNFYVFVAPYNMTNSTLAQLQADPAVSARLVPANSVLAPMIGIPVGAAGRYVRVQLVGNGYVELAEVQVFGKTGTAPTVTAVGNQQSVVGAAATATVTATDPAGTALTYAATGLPAGLSIATTTGLISGAATALGTANVVVTVTDALGLSSQTAFTWTVLNVIPTVSSLPAPVVASGATVSYNPSLTTGAPSTYSWNFGDGSAATPFSASAAASHTFASPGVYNVTLTIQTADGRSSTVTLLQAVYPAGASTLAGASSDLLLETRSGLSARIWVVNQDNDSVSVFDAVSFAKLAEIAVGRSPRTIARSSNGTMWITNHAGASISVVSASSLTVTQTIALPRAAQPYGILLSPLDGSAFVTLEATGQLLKLNSSGVTTATLSVGANIRHLAMTAAGDRLLVSQFITPPLPGEGTATVQTTGATGNNLGGQVFVVSPAAMTLSSTVILQYSNKADSDIQGSGVPNYLGAAAISPDNTTAWVPSKQDDIKRGTLRSGINLNFESVRAESSRINLATLAEDYPSRIDHDFAGFASAAVFHPTGAYLFVALETSRQIAVVDPAGKRELFRIPVGLAPRGVIVSPDGLTLYVSNFMSRSVSVINLTPLMSFGVTTLAASQTLNAVATDKLASNVLRGKQLFYDAADPRLARASFMSCAVCHNDGTFDGRTWDFTGLGEGLRNTIALNGRAGMSEGYLHWSANFDEDQDFEGQIRSLAGGSGLMNNADFNFGTRSQPLGLQKAGISPDLDALAAYLASLNAFAQDPYRNADGTLSASAQLGSAVFQSANCASCHGGLPFTNSADASQLKNIGTLNAAAGNRLGGTLTGIDIPTLRDVWATGPYLHDGSAPTISAAILAHSGVALSAADLANVAEYVQELGGEGFVGGAVGCAIEPGTCGLPANTVATVYYGTEGFGQTSLAGQSGNISCAIATFGGIDPAPNQAKSCSYVVTGILAPSASIVCGQQGELCVIPTGAVATVSYGSNGAYASEPGLTGSVACNASAFGAAAPAGGGNACSYTVTSVALPPTATSCATSNGTCTIPAGMVATVNYGTNGVYVSKPGVTGSIGCTDAIFGDPVPYVTKSCSYVITSVGTASGTGLLGQYFGNVSLSGTPTLQRVEVPNFTYAVNAVPAAGVPANYFGIRWTGTIEAPASGQALLATLSDDGVRMWFDGKLVIDDWADHASNADFATVNLIAGHQHTVMIEYHQSTGGGTMQLFWELPGSSSLEIIPAQRLYPAGAPPTADLALKKAATQSSILPGTTAGASLAVDGNTDGAFFDGSVTHTADAASNDWWQVDLGASSTINWIQLWNRTDCCSNRLQNFVVFVASYDMTHSTLAQLQADPTVLSRQVNTSTITTTIGIPVGGTGRYVRVQLLGSNYLSLAEVEVFGTTP